MDQEKKGKEGKRREGRREEGMKSEGKGNEEKRKTELRREEQKKKRAQKEEMRREGKGRGNEEKWIEGKGREEKRKGKNILKIQRRMQIQFTSQISEIQLTDKRLDSLLTRVSRKHKLPVQPTKPASCRIQCDQSALVTAEEAPPCWEEGS